MLAKGWHVPGLKVQKTMYFIFTLIIVFENYDVIYISLQHFQALGLTFFVCFSIHSPLSY